MALLNCIGRAAFAAKPIGIGVSLAFGDRIECEQMEGLHGPIFHRQNAQRAFFTLTFGNVNTPER